MPTRSFRLRSLVSLVLLWAFLGLALSGTVLYLAPRGRVARWTGWTLLGLDKDQWTALHVLLSLLFVAGTLLHVLWLNWRPTVAYLSGFLPRHRGFPELATSLAIVAVLVATTLAGLPPCSSVMTLQDRVRDAWETDGEQPPVPHLEERTLAEAARLAGVPVQALVSAARDAGLPGASPGTTLLELARAAETTPLDLWQRLRQSPGAGGMAAGTPSDGIERHPPGRGLGRMTVAEAARRAGIPVDEALRRLEARGIEAASAETLREVAGRAGLRPHDVRAILAGERGQ